MAHPDVIVVGAGIIGAACARTLACRSVTVTVLEGGPLPGAATQAAAGMLAPLAEAQPEDPLLALGVRARDLYRELVPALEAETGIEIELWTEGILQVAFSDEEVARAKSEVAWQRQRGFSVEWLSADELRRRVPGIGPDALGAVLAPEDGALDPLALRRAFLESATAHGAMVLGGTAAEQVMINGERATGVRAAATEHAAGAVVIAAGCWSGLIPGLPRPLSVAPIRGQLVALPWPKDEPPAIIYGAGGYVLERSGEAIAGTTMEHAGFDPSTTESGTGRIRQAAGRIYPALTRAEPHRRWAGLRPGTPDGRPILGRDPAVPNLWYAVGHGRNGILFAGLTGELIAHLYAGEPVDCDLHPIDPGRFWREWRG